LGVVAGRITDLKSTPFEESALAQPFDELFQALSVKGAVYYAHEFSPPWAVEFVESGSARFHLVLSGSCYVSVGDDVFELSEYDLLLLPGGSRHVVHDGKTRVARDSRVVGAEIRQGAVRARQAVASARLLSGHFEFDREARALLVLTLPAVLHGSRLQHAHQGLIEALPMLLAQELQQDQPGSETIVARLVEIFLVQMLRAHFAQAGTAQGPLSAMFEPRLNAGLTLMHARWNEPLALARIAAAAGMSRSAFAERFKTVTGTSPMSYLTRWRLLKSRRLLADRELSIARIASLCGHRSTEGYSRAFKRAFGLSPARWRAANEPP
jgi:AraC family transcriptional regulator, activator of mtrCDE